MQPNIDFITPHLATGGDLHPDEVLATSQVRHLRSVGITHIVDCRLEWTDRVFVARIEPTLAYLDNGVDDDGGRMPSGWFDRGVAFYLAARADPHAKVFVHCHMGINRGPSLAYRLLLEDGVDPIDGLDRIRAARPIAGLLYATDALAHFHRARGVPIARQRQELLACKRWFVDNDIDVRTIVRRIRSAEGPPRR